MSEIEEKKRPRENVLKIGYCTLEEIEERVKAFRIMNKDSIKKRYLITREDIYDSSGKILIQKTAEIDLSAAKLLRRHYKGSHSIKTFQPDDGIVIISDMSSPQGISFTMDIVTQIMNLGGGAYEAFIDRVDNFTQFLELIKKSLFPKLIIVGFIPEESLNSELVSFLQLKRIDKYLRSIELTHSIFKPKSYIPKMKQIYISPEDPKSWGRFVIDIIRDYTKSYLIEEI